MANLSYVAPEDMSDLEARAWLEESIERARPGPENQAIRAHQPDVLRAFTTTRKLLFDEGKGVVEKELKELIRTHIATSLKCKY